MPGIHFLRVVELPEQPIKRIVIEFTEDTAAETHVLYSEASGSEVERVLATVLQRVLYGQLRMPIDGGVRWVDMTQESQCHG